MKIILLSIQRAYGALVFTECYCPTNLKAISNLEVLYKKVVKFRYLKNYVEQSCLL